MRRALRPAAGLAMLVLARRWIGRLRDEANARRVARHEGCSLEEARRLYALARIHGYGAAHAMVLGGRPGASAGPDRHAAARATGRGEGMEPEAAGGEARRGERQPDPDDDRSR